MLPRARMGLRLTDFGMVKDADAAIAALQRLHPFPGIPHPDCDLLDPFSPLCALLRPTLVSVIASNYGRTIYSLS
jgi:hypothetical protein